ncbi:MAG TPA: TIM-barrel domain-containing protein [Labilithrix sp.]|nr:TIM-barrel domain-containing protein [Labilithrix sp.]
MLPRANRRASAWPRFVPLLFLAAPSVLGAACDDAAPPEVIELRGAEASVRITLAPFRIAILDANGTPTLETLAASDDDRYGTPSATRDDGLDNVKVLPGWDGFVPDEKPWTHPRLARLLARSASTASLVLSADEGSITVDLRLDGAKVTITTAAHAANAGWNKTSLAFALRPDEHFFGLGERYGSVDHRGLSLYSWAEEGGLGGGEGKPRDEVTPYPNGASMTYFPVPFVLSSAGYAMHLATTYRTETHLGSERPDAWRVAVSYATLTTVVYVHADPLASLDDFTRDTGRPLVPATWVFGPRRRVSSGQTALGAPEYQLLRAKHVPTTGLDDAVHLLPNRSELGREAELRAWIGSAHDAGYKVMAYNNPYVSTSIEAARGDLDYGTAHGMFALTPEGKVGETFFISGKAQTLATIDLTKPEAVAWFQDLLRRSLALGYDGWMHDFGEYVRRPWRFADGRNGEAVHNEFPVLSAKAAHDLLVAERRDDFLFFVRSGYTGTQQYVPAVWGGDAEATFDETQGLPSALRGGLNLGLSGVPYWGSDLSGFKCLTDFPRDKEVYFRWAELGAVSPIMMEQNACSNPVGAAREKWKLWNDQETIDVYGAMARLHTRLAPYFEVLAREAHARGVPVMRHPFLYHPREAEAWSAESSFYLGPSLFASPVVRRGVTVKETWLPPGRWVDLADLAVHDGGKRVALPAPLARLPLLLKDGGIVPLLDPSIETLAPARDPAVVSPEKVSDRLDVMVALSPGKEARLTLADGTELVARRKAGSAGPSGLVEVAPEQVATCAGRLYSEGCFTVRDEGMVSRLRVTTPLATTSDLVHDDVELHVAKGPVARRIRWDVLRPRP